MVSVHRSRSQRPQGLEFMALTMLPRRRRMLAYVLLGLLLANSGFSQSAEEGTAKSLHERAKRGTADAQYKLGRMYDKGQGLKQDYTEALRWYRKAADQGQANAQFRLGGMYYEGRGVLQDYTEAARWLRKAADQGQANAQFQLGLMYRHGRGLKQDYTEATRWYRKAADQGQADAQFILGLMYRHGRGVTQDYILAHKWFNLAASRATGEENETWLTRVFSGWFWQSGWLSGVSQARAERARDEVAAKMTADQIAEAQRLAREWKPKTTER